jgi:hypothetical protein
MLLSNCRRRPAAEKEVKAMAGVKSKALAKVNWDGRYKGKLLVMVDPAGKEAKPGPPLDVLARLNKDGRDAARIIEELEDKRVRLRTH